jgi:hypothetical protein
MPWSLITGEVGKVVLTWLITQAIKALFRDKYNSSWNQYIAWAVAAILTALAKAVAVPTLADPVVSAALSGMGANIGHSGMNLAKDGIEGVKAKMRARAQAK